MRTRATILFLAMMLSTAVAFARAERLIAAPPNPAEDPRVIARAVVDPEFFELALQDRELALVVAACGLPLPLPDDPKIVEFLRSTYITVPPPIPKGAIGVSELPTLPEPSKPKGFYGTRTRVMKQDRALLDAEKLFWNMPDPEQRTAHYRAYLDKRHFLGWQVDLREARTVGGVTMIQVDVYPMVTTKDGMWITPATYIKETYELKNGKLRLVKFEPTGEPAGSI